MLVLILMLFTTLVVFSMMISLFVYGQNNTNITNSVDMQNKSLVKLPREITILNPNFSFFNDTSNLPSYWNDPLKNCRTTFSCTIIFTDGWNDYVSFSISTTNSTNKTWSWIHGQEIDVKPKDNYQLVTHMKLNEWATQSHIALQGFNESSQQWYQFGNQCPSGIDGPLEWHEFSCTITIPDNTTKIKPVLNAGWSSQPDKEATTWFDSINILTNIDS